MGSVNLLQPPQYICSAVNVKLRLGSGGGGSGRGCATFIVYDSRSQFDGLAHHQWITQV